MEGTANVSSYTAGIIVVGIIISAASAIVPEYSHYKMMFGVFSAGLLPYILYGFAAAYLKPTLSLALGLTMLAIHIGLVVGERFSDSVDYSNGTIYYVPIIIAVLLIPILAMSSRRPWHH